MNRILVLILFLFFFTSCSLNENSKLWNEEDKSVSKIKDKKKFSIKEKKQIKEINPSLKLDLSKVNHNNQNNYNLLAQ